MEGWLLVIYIMRGPYTTMAIVQKPYIGWATCKKAADEASHVSGYAQAFCIPAP